MKILSKNETELSSGRKIYAHRLMFSINKNMEIGYGADGDILTDGYYEADGSLTDVWTKDEKRELSEYMISLWKEFGNV